MTDELIVLLDSYLRNKVDIEAVRSWLAINVWNVPDEAVDLIDQVAVELAYVDDNVSDEKHFRNRMSELLSSISKSPTTRIQH